MNIAILISGEPRFDVQLDSFINSLQQATSVDWYFYLWSSTVIKPGSPRLQVPAQWENISSTQWATETIQKNLPNGHKVAGLEIGNQQEVIDLFNSDSAVFKQFYSLYRADVLRRTSGVDYDLVVRGRPDLDIKDPIDLNMIKNDIEQNTSLIFTPSSRRYGPYDINDQMAISSGKNIEIYSDLVLHINEYAQKGVDIHQETQLGYHLINNGLNIQRSISVGDLRNLGNTVTCGRWGS
jgi:hypothetical protein